MEGRPFIAATIADAATLKALDRYRDIQARLADPRKTKEAEAEKLFSRRQGGGADHLLDSLDRARQHAHGGGVRLEAVDRG